MACQLLQNFAPGPARFPEMGSNSKILSRSKAFEGAGGVEKNVFASAQTEASKCRPKIE